MPETRENTNFFGNIDWYASTFDVKVQCCRCAAKFTVKSFGMENLDKFDFDTGHPIALCPICGRTFDLINNPEFEDHYLIIIDNQSVIKFKSGRTTI